MTSPSPLPSSAEAEAPKDQGFRYRIGGILLTLAVLLIAFAPAGRTARREKAPEFPSQDPKEWIGPPQSLKALAGKVVILDVWTFG